jgi:site-specific DNA-methyltransferase (adenine-specific)
MKATTHQGEVLDCFQTITTGSINAIVTDPPYNIGLDYGSGAKADRRTDADYIAWLNQWVAESARVLTPNGSLWLIVGQEYAAHFDLAIQAAGLTMRNRLTWFESFGVNCQRKFNRCSRPMFYAVKDAKQFTFNREAVTRPSDRQTKYGDKRAAAGGKNWDDVWSIPRLAGTHAERVKVCRPDGTKTSAPTQLPLALVDPIIGCITNPGDTVLDPFCGTGTVGVSAVTQGRQFIGFDLQPHWINTTTARLSQIDSGPTGTD